MPVKTPSLPLLLVVPLLAVGACQPSDPDAADGDANGAAAPAAADGAGPRSDTAPIRPPTRTDTLLLEGMPEPVQLSLFRTPEDFPLPFSAYVPEDMAPEVDEGEQGGSLRFVAEFGGRRNPDAFVHLWVFPPGTDVNAAVGAARGYKASRGIPVSKGLEPLGGDGPAADLPWAMEAYRFHYETSDLWYTGSIGVGSHDGRLFQIVQHYPEDYADGFPARADMITGTWVWADGEPLIDASELPAAEAGN